MGLKQQLLRQVVDQFHRPHGLSGRIVGWIMARRSSNRRRSLWVVSLLDVQPADRVLEIGFGPGIAIRALSDAATAGRVYGVDHSDLMVRQAIKRNRAAIRAGRVDLLTGSVENLPMFGDALDAVMSVNSMLFWPDPPLRLEELRDRLRPGGRIAIASQPRCAGANKETSKLAGQQIEALLNDAGFADTRVETLPLDPPVVCVLGVKKD